MDISTLKAHLGEELFTQVEEKLRDLDGLAIIPTNDGSWLPKARLDEELGKQKTLKGTVATLTQQLAEAKKAGESAAALQATVESLTQQVKDRDATITGMKRSGKIREALTKARVRDASVVEKLLDASRIGEDDKGNLTGLDEQVKALKASSGYLFEEEKGGRAGFGGGKNPDSGSGGGIGGNGEINALIRAAAGRNAE
ncbi:MAG: phage scaffolding protein [Clostridia bacterium]|nr:phage scaffolding protein [Clostridia bacterium]